MNDYDKLIKRITPFMKVKEINTTISTFNCFGEKIEEKTDRETAYYTWDNEDWIKGSVNQDDEKTDSGLLEDE